MRKTLSGLFCKKLLLPILLLALTGMAPLFAIDVRFTPPKFEENYPGINQLNLLLENIFTQYGNEIGNTLGPINIDPRELTGAFAASSIFASTGATQRGYGGYDLFAITVGAMGGIRVHGNPFTFVEQIYGIVDNVERLDDINMGFNPQILNAQIGFNASKLLLNNLYLGLKLGYFKLDSGPVTFSTPSIGVMANYQLIPQIKVPLGILAWRGINLGTGLIYQYTDMEIGIPLPSKREQINILGIFSTPMSIDSKLILAFTENTFTIPLEAVTSLRLLGFLNLSAGIGADLGFGIVDFRLTGDATVSFENLPDYLNPLQNAGLSASTRGTNSPDIFNPKLMAGLGFNIGPVIIDIPVTYYFTNNGYNFGITLGLIM